MPKFGSFKYGGLNYGITPQPPEPIGTPSETNPSKYQKVTGLNDDGEVSIARFEEGEYDDQTNQTYYTQPTFGNADVEQYPDSLSSNPLQTLPPVSAVVLGNGKYSTVTMGNVSQPGGDESLLMNNGKDKTTITNVGSRFSR